MLPIDRLISRLLHAALCGITSGIALRVPGMWAIALACWAGWWISYRRGEG